MVSGYGAGIIALPFPSLLFSQFESPELLYRGASVGSFMVRFHLTFIGWIFLVGYWIFSLSNRDTYSIRERAS
jgi:hypothetical protein